MVALALCGGCSARGLDFQSGVIVGDEDLASPAADLALPPPADLGAPGFPPAPGACAVVAVDAGSTLPVFELASVDAGQSVESIAVGDLDGDGHPDLVTANRNDFVTTASGDVETVSVILSAVGGGFQPQTKYWEPLYPTTVALGDFNHDGLRDLVTDTGMTLQVRLSAGHGLLSASTGYADNTRGAPGLVVVDVDGDGVLDLVSESLPTSPGGLQAIDLRRGRGDGTFTDRWTLNGAGGELMGGGDFDEDGRGDVVFASQETKTLGIALGQPDGTLLPGTIFALPQPSYPSALAVGDIDGDGHLDVALVVYTTDGPHAFLPCGLTVILGDGRGGFGCLSQYAARSCGWSVAIADVNRDGRADVIAADYSNGALMLYAGTGGGALAPAVAMQPSMPYPAAITATDLDGDGRIDLAVGSSMTANVSLLYNRTP
jgi:hypothetical protein